MGHVKTFLARWQHHRFSPSRTQRRGGGALSSIRPNGWSDPDRTKPIRCAKAPERRMACVTWRYVPRGTCHVPPHEPLRKQSLGQNFRRGGRRDPKLAWYMRPGMAHVPCKWRPQGSKYCPQGAILFLALCPLASDTLGPRVTKFGTQVEANKIHSALYKFRGPKIRGSTILNFRKKFILIISE